MTNENRMYNKPMYKCGICGKVYDTIAERMKCERTCLDKQEIEAKKAALEKKKEEQKARKAEVDTAIKQANEATDHANKLMRDYVADYGSYAYADTDKKGDGNGFFWPGSLSHHFWF